jgi:hypothetical protein
MTPEQGGNSHEKSLEMDGLSRRQAVSYYQSWTPFSQASVDARTVFPHGSPDRVLGTLER